MLWHVTFFHFKFTAIDKYQPSEFLLPSSIQLLYFLYAENLVLPHVILLMTTNLFCNIFFIYSYLRFLLSTVDLQGLSVPSEEKVLSKTQIL